MHDHPQTVEHEPCRLLGDADSAVNVVRANAIPAIRKHPESAKPFVQTDGRVLENGSHLQRELLFAVAAIPELPRFHEVVVIGLTTWARYLTVWPAKLLGILKATLGIAEVDDGLLQRVGRFHVSKVGF